MRALLIAACIASFVAAVTAQCGAPPVVDPFRPTSCAAVLDCQSAFCGCVGASNATRNATLCLATSSAGCSLIETCMRNYTQCLQGLTSQRSSADAVCNATGSAMHAAVLSAVVDKYAGSVLQTGCAFHVCTVMNSSKTTCNFGTNATTVCLAPDGSSSFAVRAVFKLSGTAWGQLLNNAARRQSLEAGLRGDIAALLKVAMEFIVLLNLTEGSLIVDFAVLTGSPASTAQLTAAVSSASANTSWLTATKSVYSVVSNETITVQSVQVISVGGSPAPSTNSSTPSPSANTPAPSNPTPTGTSPSGAASSASVLAVAAAVVALLVAM